jgi:hypothetical protein
VTTPFSTVATLSLFELQVSVLLVVSSGLTDGISVALSPRASVNSSLSRVIPVAGISGGGKTGFSETVTVREALFPFVEVTIISALPSEIALTLPKATVATAGLLDVHSKTLSVEPSGVISAYKSSDSPT